MKTGPYPVASIWPRRFSNPSRLPVRLCRAVAPIARIRSGFTSSISASSHHLQCSISVRFGGWCRRRLPCAAKLEMLHRIGDIGRPPVEPRLPRYPVEKLAGGPDERPALLVFLIPRLLAHDHQPGVRRPFARHRLPGIAVKRAAGAAAQAARQIVQGLRHGTSLRRLSALQDLFRAHWWQGRGGKLHLAGAGLGPGDKLRDVPRLGHVLPVFARHFRGHRLHLQPCGIEDVAEIGAPKLLCAVLGQVGFRVSVLQRQTAVFEPRRDVRCRDDPVHVGEAAGEERRGGLDGVMRRLEPGGELAAPVLLADIAKPHEGLHLVRAAADVLFHQPQPRQVGVSAVSHQAGRVLQPPEKGVKPGEPFGIGVPDDGFREIEKRLRYRGPGPPEGAQSPPSGGRAGAARSAARTGQEKRSSVEFSANIQSTCSGGTARCIRPRAASRQALSVPIRGRLTVSIKRASVAPPAVRSGRASRRCRSAPRVSSRAP